MQAVHPPGRHPAHRTLHRITPGTRHHPDQITLSRHTLDDQRGQPRKHHTHKGVDLRHASA
ncbi:hypothetical protein ACIBBE_44720 [Streptomyces sp. NPDC051644]|uniref:hypothetical protein n=1 Tax=Streptomyces sp. NPDC051644 TaxID=3365666 RepID=UPI0037B833EF